MPTEFPQHQIDPICKSVGMLVINWAMVEQTIEMIVAVIYRSADGHSQEEKLPKFFSRKAKFVRRCLSRISALHDFQLTGRKLMEEATRLSKIRHDVIHGALSGFDEETGVVSFIRVDIDKNEDIHQEVRCEHSIEEILNAGVDCISLTAKLHDYVNRLIAEFVGELPFEKAVETLRTP